MNRMLRYLFVVGMGLFFCWATLFYKPSIGYARGCALVPPWKYNFSVTFEPVPDIPLNTTQGFYKFDHSTPATLVNPTSIPIYLIPTQAMTSTATIEQLISHPYTIKLVDHKNYAWDYNTKSWYERANEQFPIDNTFLSTMPVPIQSSCANEQQFNGLTPPPIHDHLTLVYNQRIIELPGVMEYVENLNYQQEYDTYIADKNKTLSILKNTVTGVISVFAVMIGLLIGLILLIWIIVYLLKKKKK